MAVWKESSIRVEVMKVVVVGGVGEGVRGGAGDVDPVGIFIFRVGVEVGVWVGV